MAVTSDSARRFLVLALGAVTAAQAVAAVLFYFAGNWWGMAPSVKIGLIDGMLLLCAVAAALSVPGSFARSVWSASGAVLSGVLFGVHGQIWQTGADAWQLFVLWAGLAAVWALLARSDACWVIAAGLGMVAIWLWGDTSAPYSLLPDEWSDTAMAVSPLLVLGASRAAGSRPGSWLFPVLLAMVAGALGVGGVGAMFHHDYLPVTLALGAAGATMAVAKPARFGPWPFAIALLLAVVMAESLVIKFGLDLFSTAGLMLLGIGAFAWKSRRLFADQVGVVAARLEFMISLAIGVGSWIAAGTTTFAVALGAGLVSSSERNIGVVVAVVSMAVFGVLRLAFRKPNPFAHHMQSAFITIAYGSVLAHMAVNKSELETVTLAAVAMLVPLVLASSGTLPGAAGVITALVLSVAALERQDHELTLVLSVAAAVAGWFGLPHGRHSVRAGAVCLLLAAFVIPAWEEFQYAWMAEPARIAAALAAAGLLAAVFATRRDLASPRLIAAGVLVVGGSVLVPAGCAGLAGLIAVSTRALGRTMVILAFAFAGWSVWRYYYLLEVPLIGKAELLAGGAVATAAAWALLGGRPSVRPQFAMASALMLAGALLPAAVQAWDARGKLKVLAEGRQVFLPLRPVDPRSLFQGDYMALNYDWHVTQDLPHQGGPAALKLNADGVAVASRALAGSDIAADEVVVNVRQGRLNPKLAPDSFMFEEGTGRDWSSARFAEVRVFKGTLVLVGLVGWDRKPITPEFSARPTTAEPASPAPLPQ
ncbi:MAG TPA: GDYXXLXY domain-containing protein [Magnetospirillum sp.]|nr:GDYXXLXY domain-containing protein [Magnetospirillum sp.]